MAEIAKSGTPSVSHVDPPAANRLSGRIAGEAIAAGDQCYIKSDGLIWLATGAAATAPARVRGTAATDAVAGDPLTLFYGVNFRYGAGLTPGADVFLSGTVAGGLADAASTGGTTAIGYCVDATRIHFFHPH